jgi:hypothetical protein
MDAWPGFAGFGAAQKLLPGLVLEHQTSYEY